MPISLNTTQKRIGTLVPISALFSSKLSQNDIGTFAVGPIFLDWLKKTKQSAWQLLPLYQTQLETGSTTKHVPSPYKSYGIGLDPKYLPEAFAGIYPAKSEKKDFIEDNKEWLSDYAFFCALRDYFQTDDWRKWDEGLRNRDKATLDHWRNQLSKAIDTHIVLQWQLHSAYTLFRKKAKELDIMLIGDLPFYPSVQSPLVWANQDIFQLEKNGEMRFVSGAPNSPTAHFGRQIWGHPLYNWNNLEKIVAFWKMRLRYQATLFDDIRFDHAKGIFSYGVMDANNEQNDRYIDGPGAEVFKKLITFSQQNDLAIFAEDNGDKTEELRKTLKELDIPGIKIFLFALKKNENIINDNYANIAAYPKNCVAYTSTHDTETLLSYLHAFTQEQKQHLAAATNISYEPDDKIFAKRLRDAILTSPAQLVIIPIQDWLLTTDRINIPGTELPINDPNWNFHLKTPIEKLPTHF